MAPSTTPADQAAAAAAKTIASRWPVWQLALTGAGVVLTMTAGLWYVLSPEPPTPADRLATALELLDAGRDRQARELADALEAEDYHDVDFAGGVEYALGMCHFLEGMARTQADAAASFATAVTYLREADRRGVPENRRLTQVFALGTSLLRLNDRAAALPLLEECSQPANPHHVDAALDLVSIYLDPTWRTSARLQSGLRLNDVVLSAAATEHQRVLGLQQRVELLLASKEFTEANARIAELNNIPGHHHSITVLTARVLMGQENFVAAVQLLDKVAREDQLDRTQPRQASFLMGLASERRMLQLDQLMQSGDRRPTLAAERAEYRQRALEYYARTVNRFDHTDEALVAHVRLGRLQQEDGAYEKAIQSFGTALRTVKRAEEFSNRWIGLEEFRQRILAGWNTWIDQQRFPEAIALADLMTPAFPRDQAYELAARARQRWAEQADERWNRSTTSEREANPTERNQLWRESAQAFARLAEARRTAANYPEAVWQAADHYYRGQDYLTALEYMNQFLQEASNAMRPVAMVRRGQILLDLDRLKDAEADFREVQKKFPTSPAAFTAAYQLAVCRLEQNDTAGAEAALRQILSSAELAPTALEWRNALLALAKMQNDRASWSRRQLERTGLPETEIKALWADLSSKSRETTELLEQYLSRYPQSPDSAEARYTLGKALQLQGDFWQRNQLTAETENARAQAEHEKQSRLERAQAQFLQVRETLATAAEQDRLSPVQQLLYRNAWFEYPHTLFALGRDQEAVTAYAATIHQFPTDVRVLTAYVQMAEAYARLQRPIEAQSMLEQARVILDQHQIPTAAFLAPTTSLSRAEWEQWLDRARRIHRE